MDSNLFHVLSKTAGFGYHNLSPKWPLLLIHYVKALIF